MNRTVYAIQAANNTLLICRNRNVASIVNCNGLFYGENPMKYTSPLLMMQISVISLVSLATHYCLGPLGQFSTVSQIFAGIILGPSCIGHDKVFLSTLFPERSHTTLETIATFGVMIVLFLMGVKTDPGLARQCGAKSIVIGLSVFFIPLAFSISISVILIRFIPMSENLHQALPLIAASQSLTGFMNISGLLTELKMLNTDLGRLAVGAAIVADMLGISSVAIILPLMQSKVQIIPTALGWLTPILMVAFIVYVLRPATQWIIKQTPEGKNVKEDYLFAVFIMILGIGCLSEIIGQHFVLGPLAFGLAVPDGPPLGAALVQKLDPLANGILFPTFLAVSGLKTNIFSISFESSWILGLAVTIIFIVKTVSGMLPCLYYNKPLRESFVLGIALNTKGVAEIVLLNIWKDIKILDNETFTLGVITMILQTAVIGPVVKALHDPTKRYVSSQRCTIQHAKRDVELRVLVCVKKKEHVPTLIDLIKISHATKESPIVVFVLQLRELVGRNSPILVYHQPECSFSNKDTETDRTINAFRNYELQNQGVISVYPFTAIAHLATVHDDVCNLAIDKKVNIVIVPFHKEWAIDGQVDSENYAIRSMNRNILDKAPCSVGILVDRSILSGTLSVLTSQSAYRVALLYTGSNDDGETLAYASRMAEHDSVTLTVIRFLVFGCDNARERKLDNDVINLFKLNNAYNDRIQYKEEVIKDSEGLVTLVKGMGECYDLMLVGRHQHKDSRLFRGLSEWDESPELGPLGDMLASTDMKGTSSILVVQQPRLKAKLKNHKDRDSLIHDEPFGDGSGGDGTWTIKVDR